ncbi:AAA family ATPase [Clostridium fermenticellae]|uniref:AAA family ATPase n=1 Tax=Clostridium fermenticellae TaxID=2068654 RepID=A0A386H2M6_9CLOT|nr:AAA family ATPase [Clostridium fermenticellae]AYD39904.1 AAA family ATPase [Clostridium fermenticellae]
MGEFNIIKLKVKEGLLEDSRKGIVRMNREDMEQLGVDTGDTIKIKGKRDTSAKVYPSFNDIYGMPFIQMDGTIRRNSGIKLNESVTITKTEIKTARRVALSTTNIFFKCTEDDEKEVKNLIRGIPVISGDEVTLMIFGHNEIVFHVSGTAPSGPVVIKEETDLIFMESEFSSSKARVTYEDIGGLNQEIKRIREIVELPLKYPDAFRKLGFEPPKGILLYGPPGTGKTLIARAIASETEAHFIHVNGPEIMNKFYGESEAKIREIFKEAKSKAPSIIFMDEIDSIAPKREFVHGEVEKRVVAQFLALMDGLESRGQVIVIGATNILDSLDPALRRPGRFDKEIAILPPNKEGRLNILKIHTNSMPLHEKVNLRELARITYGFVGSDISALCKEAGMVALRNVLPKIETGGNIPPFKVTMENFIEALKEIEPSSAREYVTESPDVKWEEVGGLDEIKETMKILLEFPLIDPKLCKEYNFRSPKGILLTGPSGSGKTLLAKAIGNYVKENFITISGLTLSSHWMGESEKVLHDIFVKAKQSAPCILFFDEIDAITRSRSNEANNLTDMLISQLIYEFDKLRDFDGVTVLAATNRINLIDSVLFREGRFEYVIELKLPDIYGRESILKIHAQRLPLTGSIDFRQLAESTEGMTGAELANLCHRTSFIAITRAMKTGLKVKIDQEIFNQAITKVNSEKNLKGVRTGKS